MKLVVICIGLLFSTLIIAQAPYAFNYQGVAKDSDGFTLYDQAITLRISLIEDFDQGDIVFIEEHYTSTNASGLFALRIGQGEPILGNLRTIEWGDHDYYIRTEIDIQGGTSFVDLGTTQLFSVPYALYAAQSGGSDEGGTDDQLLQLSGNTLSIEDGNAVDLSAIAGDDADADPQNELQTLSISGQTLSITGGNSVTLPSSSSGGADDQNLSFTGTTLSIEGGNSVNLSSLQDGFVDADADPSNELQSLTLTGNTLSLSGANSVTLPQGGSGDTYWESDEDFSIFYDGWVGVNLGDKRLITMSENISNSGDVEIYGENESSNLWFTSLDEYPNNGAIGIGNSESEYKIITYVNSDNAGEFWAGGDNGNANVFISHISSSANSGFIGVYNEDDRSVAMNAELSGQGNLTTYGSNGNTNTRLSWLNGRTNNGYISVHDTGGNEQAGLYVNSTGQGVVFADLKNFKTDHPKNNEKEIVYASLEGPEAAAYVRGTATLEHGSASIDFPEYFSLIISGTAGMTVHITPLSAESKGIAVVKKGKSGFRVQELLGGNGTYEFDWEVKAVRAGYEDYKVVRNKNQDRPERSSSSHPEPSMNTTSSNTLKNRE